MVSLGWKKSNISNKQHIHCVIMQHLNGYVKDGLYAASKIENWFDVIDSETPHPEDFHTVLIINGLHKTTNKG